MDCMVHGVARSQTQLSQFHFHCEADRLFVAFELTFLLPCSLYILFRLVKKEINENPITTLVK